MNVAKKLRDGVDAIRSSMNYDAHILNQSKKEIRLKEIDAEIDRLRNEYFKVKNGNG